MNLKRLFACLEVILVATTLFCTAVNTPEIDNKSVGMGWRKGTDKEFVEDTECRKSKNGFGGWLAVTTDIDWREKWFTPFTYEPKFTITEQVKQGEELAILTFYVNPATDASGNAHVTSDIKVTQPDGKVIIEKKGIPCLKGSPGDVKGSILLSPAVIRFVAEESEPAGVWKLEVSLTDHVGNTRLDLKNHFELLKGSAQDVK